MKSNANKGSRLLPSHRLVCAGCTWPAWVSPSLVLLFLVGFLKEFKPSEPFLTPYLIDYKHLSNDQINNDVYPLWTYSYLGMLVLVLLCTDLVRYAPTVVFGTLAYLITRVLLLWANGVQAMQLMQYAYGTATAADIAYTSAIYVLTTQTHFRRLTAISKATVLTAQTGAGILAQLLVSIKGSNLLVLNYISLGSVSASVLLATLFLFRVRTSDFEGLGDPLLRTLRPASTSACRSSHEQESGDEGEVHKAQDHVHHVSSRDADGPDAIDTPSAAPPSHQTHLDNSAVTPGSLPLVDLADAYRPRVTTKRNAPRTASPDISLHEPLLPTSESGEEDGLIFGFQRTRSQFSGHLQSGLVPVEKHVHLGMNHSDQYSSRPRPVWQQHMRSLVVTSRACYTDAACRRWCVWWVLATCVNLQVENYIQTLWEAIAPDRSAKHAYNGGVTACATFVGIGAALLAACIPIKADFRAEVFLAVLSAIGATALLIAARAASVWTAYTMYVVFAALFTLLITVVNAELARALVRLHGDGGNFAFVFGVNMFFALVLQTILTSIVNSSLQLTVRTQFVVYGILFLSIAILFAVVATLRRAWRT
jgi:hypothetical protein